MTGTKLCHSCKVVKPFCAFYKNSGKPDGLQTQCKECQNSRRKKYYKTNIKEERKKRREYYADNIEKCKKQSEIYRKSHPRVPTDRSRALARSRYANRTKEQIDKERVWKREYQRRNKDKVHKWHKKYRESHKEQLKEYSRLYREKNREKILCAHLNRLHNDANYKLKEQTRNMLRCAFRTYGHRKDSHTKDIVGCDLDYLSKHLRKTWLDRYGTDWNGEPCHIDHIVPLAMAKTKEDIIKLCHYTNLQLLTPEDNLSKSGKSPSETEAHLLSLL